MLKEFKEFAMRGNVLDLAIGIVIGAAFGRIISSFVADILMPPVGLLLGGADFSNRYLVLRGNETYATLAEAKRSGAVTMNYGLFFNSILDFAIVAFAIFLLVRQVNRMRKEKAPPPPDTKECPMCASNVPKKARRCPMCTSEITT